MLWQSYKNRHGVVKGVFPVSAPGVFPVSKRGFSHPVGFCTKNYHSLPKTCHIINGGKER